MYIGNVKQIACGELCSFILLNNGTIIGCGDNTSYQLGCGNINGSVKKFIKIPISNVKQIACGCGTHTLVLLNDGTIMGCGNNSSGQLGLGDENIRYNFTKVPDISNVKQIFCGESHTFILLNDGTIMGCGNNSSGQLGLGDTTNRNTFTKVPYISNVKQIACGRSSFILLEDGTIMSCGGNYTGLANNDSHTFTKIPDISNVKQITCGQEHTFVLLNDGTIMGCGYNGNGQLGIDNSNTNYKSTFTKVPDISNVKQITCGESHTFILLNDGTIMGCGNNGSGQLGLGDTNSSVLKFTKIKNINNIKQIACGHYHSFILLNDNTIMNCGDNDTAGQLGSTQSKRLFNPYYICDTTDILIGMNTSSIDDIRSIVIILLEKINNMQDTSSFGDDIKKCNTKIDNLEKILNDKVLEKLNEKPKPNPTDIKQVSCGNEHTVILYNNNTIKATGNNAHGQLGLGDNADRNVFTEL